MILKSTRVLEVLKFEKIIPDSIFQIEEHHLDSYIHCYGDLFGRCCGLKRMGERSLARKIAGLNLLKYNFDLGAKFNNMKSGLVYLVQNPAFPNHIKVGMTIDLISRLESYQTSDPFRKFEVIRYDFVLNRMHIEKRILSHPDVVRETGEWLEKSSALNIFELIVKNKNAPIV